MNTSKPTLIAQFNYIGCIELPVDVIAACHHSGQCEDDIEGCMQLPEVIAELAKIDPEKLKIELAEYGAWDQKQLSDHTENLKRILWLASGDIQDEQYQLQNQD